MKNFPEKPHFSSTTETTITTTTIKFQTAVDDWDKPFSNEELEAIEAAFEAATSAISATPSYSSSSFKTPRSSSSVNNDDDPNARPTTRRRLPGSISCSNGELGSSPNSSYFALTPCSRNWAFHHQGSVKMKYPALNFGGRIVYSRTMEEVEEATLEILKFLEAKKCKTGRAVLGLDIEWKPSFDRGTKGQGGQSKTYLCRMPSRGLRYELDGINQ